jgi:antitoxin ParD1/3/4
MANFAKSGDIVVLMTTMNVSLPEELKSFVDDRVERDGFGSTSEYVRDLIRRDQDRLRLRQLLLDGANSAPGPPADDDFFTALRERSRTRA